MNILSRDKQIEIIAEIAALPSHFPDERALLPDPSRTFPFGWGFHLVGGLVVPHPAIRCQIWTDAPAIRESMVARWGQLQADLQGQRDGY